MNHRIKMFTLLLAFFINGIVNAEQVLRMSTTTSTENSGLLAVLNPVFEQQHHIRVDVIAVGTGKALRLGRNGDVDIVFVHAPRAEKKFVADGFGVDRTAVMHNDFVLLGAKTDLAHIKKAASAAKAMQKISAAKADFVSRGDDSGTHKKERQLWQLAGVNPSGAWYLSAGQGMGAVLTIADEKQAYTLSDRGTYIAFQDKIDLQILFENDQVLFNPYHIMAVNPKRYPYTRYYLAKKYIDFVISEQGQAIIGTYKKAGQQLFYPDVNH